MSKLELKLVGMSRNWWAGIESGGPELKLVGFKVLIEAGGLRSIEIFMSCTRLISVGRVIHIAKVGYFFLPFLPKIE